MELFQNYSNAKGWNHSFHWHLFSQQTQPSRWGTCWCCCWGLLAMCSQGTQHNHGCSLLGSPWEWRHERQRQHGGGLGLPFADIASCVDKQILQELCVFPLLRPEAWGESIMRYPPCGHPPVASPDLRAIGGLARCSGSVCPGSRRDSGNTMQTRCIARKGDPVRLFVKICHFIKTRGSRTRTLSKHAYRENQNLPKFSERAGLFWASPFSIYLLFTLLIVAVLWVPSFTKVCNTNKINSWDYPRTCTSADTPRQIRWFWRWGSARDKFLPSSAGCLQANAEFSTRLQAGAETLGTKDLDGFCALWISGKEEHFAKLCKVPTFARLIGFGFL